MSYHASDAVKNTYNVQAPLHTVSRLINVGSEGGFISKQMHRYGHQLTPCMFDPRCFKDVPGPQRRLSITGCDNRGSRLWDVGLQCSVVTPHRSASTSPSSLRGVRGTERRRRHLPHLVTSPSAASPSIVEVIARWQSRRRGFGRLH